MNRRDHDARTLLRLFAAAAVLALSACGGGAGSEPRDITGLPDTADAADAADISPPDVSPDGGVADMHQPDLSTGDALAPQDTGRDTLADVPAPDAVEPDAVEPDAEGPADVADDIRQDSAEPADVTDDIAQDAADPTDVTADVAPDPCDDWPEPPPEEVIGQINVVYFGADALFPYPDIMASAVFSPTLAASSVENAVGWLGVAYGWKMVIHDGAWTLPDVGDWRQIDYDEPLGTPPTDYLDAGDHISLGAHMVAPLEEMVFEETGCRVFHTDPEESTTVLDHVDITAPLELVVAGGADVCPATVTDALALPAPIELTSHDPREVLPIRYGGAVEFSWVPETAEGDTIVLEGQGLWDGFLIHAVDEGGLSPNDWVPGAEVTYGADPAFGITRYRERFLQLREGRVRVVTETKQWLYGLELGPWRVEPNEWYPGQRLTVRVELWDWLFDHDTFQVETDADVEIESAAITDTVGRIVELVLVVQPGAASGPVELRLTDAGRSAPLVLPAAAWVVDELPSAGDCESAVDEGPVGDGSYVSSDAGLELDLFSAAECLPGPAWGREQAVPLTLLAGQTLEAQVYDTLGWPALYLAESCGGAIVEGACSGSPGPAARARLRYTALEDRDVLLVVDSFFDSDVRDQRYRLDIQRAEPQPLVLSEPVLTAGADVELTIHSTVGDFDAADLHFAFGEGIEIDTATVPGDVGPVAELSLWISSGATAGPRDVVARVGGEDRVLTGGLYVREWVLTAFSCDEAMQSPALAPGLYEGDSTIGAPGLVSPGDCLNWTTDAPEAIYRVELGPSERLFVEAQMDGFDGALYLLDGCPGVVLTCGDQGETGVPEFLEWRNGQEARSVFLVVDGYTFDDAGPFFLEMEVGL